MRTTIQDEENGKTNLGRNANGLCFIEGACVQVVIMVGVHLQGGLSLQGQQDRSESLRVERDPKDLTQEH